MAFKSASEAKTEWFDVTAAAHESPKEFEITSASGKIGSAKVWTGTLLGTAEDDVLQSHATFSVENAEGAASLIMSFDSRFAKSSAVLETKTAVHFLLIPDDLKCERI